MRITSFKNNDVDFFRDFYISILIDREIEDAKILFKKNKIEQTGYIYAPYIPMTLLPVIGIPTGLKKTGMISRYNKKIIDRNLYGTITVGEFL